MSRALKEVSVGARQMSGGKDAPERNNRRCRSPEVGGFLACLRSQEAGMARA